MEIGPLTRGIIVTRYKRFLADVELADGQQVTVHCPNTGSMTSCWQSGAPVELSYSDNPRRKLAYTLERVDMGAGWVGVNTARVNGVIAEGVVAGAIGALAGYGALKREPRFDSPHHRASRFDLLLTDGAGRDAYVEIKNTTLLTGDTVQFPDAVTERGRKHLELLAEAVGRGFRGVIVFAVNRPEGRFFEPAYAIDPAWGACLERVIEAGVEVVLVRLVHTATGLVTGASVEYP